MIHATNTYNGDSREPRGTPCSRVADLHEAAQDRSSSLRVAMGILVNYRTVITYLSVHYMEI